MVEIIAQNSLLLLNTDFDPDTKHSTECMHMYAHLILNNLKK